MKRINLFFIAVLILIGILFSLSPKVFENEILYQNGELLVETKPIKSDTDFRAVWVTTLTGDIASYSNVTQYQAEINKVFAVMEYYNMNVMVFHIRTHNNALYKSSLNPVASYYRLVDFDTWDPITWMIEQCHIRGMEFHAWLNPYRCSTSFSGTTTEYAQDQPIYNVASNPENLLKTSNGIILNPGEPAVRQFVVDTCMEVIERYDIDAIHFDDYFYADGIDDTATRLKYNSENLSVDNFRRQQVDLFIEKLSQTMREYNVANDRLVQLGVAPTGIYRNSGPGIETVYDSNGTLITPAGSTTGGFEHYGNYLFCDTKKWIDNEWIDYIIPQSYWGFSHPVAGFINVMSWWAKVVKYKNVNLYSGMGLYMAGSSNTYSWVTDTAEASKQIDYCDTLPEVQGHCIFSYKHIESAYDQKAGRYLENMKNVKANNWTDISLVPEIRTYDPINLPAVESVLVSDDENGYIVNFPKLNQAKFYAIYRGVDELSFTADEIIAITAATSDATDVTYFDEVAYGQYFYGVRPISMTNTLGEAKVATTNVTGIRVRFLNDDGTVLKIQYLPTGSSAIAPEEPIKEGFDFAGWDHELTNLTESIDISAIYSIKMLTVTFKDGDTVLSTQQVAYGGTAIIDDPTKEGHIFDGWTKTLENIKQDTTIYASFSPIKFSVIFLGRDGLAIKSDIISYGEFAVSPTMEDAHFIKWDQDFSNVTSNLIIKPLFDDAYKLTFKIDDTIVLEVSDAKGSFTLPSIPTKVGYDQQMPVWSVTDFFGIEEDTIVTALYQVNNYTVVFLGLNGKVLSTEIVNYQEAAIAPTNTSESGYSFSGWDKDFASVTENMVVHGNYVAQSTSSCAKTNLSQLTFLLVALAWLFFKRKK
ncbi:MAG: family 10 glycosylhydrolase [Bacilli bacterium]